MHFYSLPYARLRYFLGGHRPSETTPHTFSEKFPESKTFKEVLSQGSLQN